ncbi:MAG: flagellar basal body L-ring protein FlgH [Thermodesulfobacteriota bacterium]
MKKASLLVFISCFLGGCIPPGQNSSTALPARHSLPPVQNERLMPEEGSIFSAHTMDLYRDQRAHKVGDIVTVTIVETSSSAHEATTETTRDSSVSGDISYLFRFAEWAKLRENTPNSRTLGASLKNDFNGEGETTRDNTMTATISARVIDVTMNGNLIIQGYREVKTNNETQHIILSGLIRPADISPDNVVKSSQIADARIEISGEGAVSDKQQPGWLAKGVDILWPF